MSTTQDSRRGVIALGLMALLGVALIFIFPGSPEQDTGFHFLMARTAWSDPSYFVNVWARPLYTFVFAVPVLMGFTAARLFAVGIGVATGWQSWRLACDLKMERAWMVIPLMLAQPVFLELFPDLLTEPLFALLFVVALRWFLRGWTKRSMLAASLLPLARPEGVFICLLWGLWVLARTVRRANPGEPRSRRILPQMPRLLILASGMGLWWIAALIVTGDPLYILHNWPATWHQGVYGTGTAFSYARRSYEFIGELLAAPFLIGLLLATRRPRWTPLVTSFLMLFTLHSVMRAFGLMGEAGYPRYMVTVSSVTAIFTLAGWNAIASWIRSWFPLRSRWIPGLVGASVLLIAIAQSFLYMNSLVWARDSIAISEMCNWLQKHPHPHCRLVWSNAAMCVLRGQNPEDRLVLKDGDDGEIGMLRRAPSGTMVFWDNHFGPEQFGLSIADIIGAGYRSLRIQRYSLRGIADFDMNGVKVGSRELELALLYKP